MDMTQGESGTRPDAWSLQGLWQRYYWILVAILAVPTLALATRAVVDLLNGAYFPYMDYKYWRLAALCWSEGQSPYTECFHDTYLQFGWDAKDSVITPFPYPPTVLPLLAPLALPPEPLARWAWFIASLGAMAGAARLFAISLASPANRLAMTILIGAGILFLCDSTILGLMVGQLTPFLMLALAAFLHGMDRHRFWLTAVSLAVLLVKPQFGLVIGFAAFLDPRTRPAAILAGVITIALAAIAMFRMPLDGIVTDYLAVIGAYNHHGLNNAFAMSGIGHLLVYIGLEGFGTVHGLLLGLAGAAALHVTVVAATPDTDRRISISLLIAWMFLVQPHHNYDFLLLLPFTAPVLMRREISLPFGLTLLGTIVLSKCITLAAAGADDVMPLAREQSIAFVNTIGALLVAAGLFAVHRESIAVRRPGWLKKLRLA